MRTRDLSSQSQLEILRFFVNNPNTIDTPRGVSVWTNLPYADTTKILERFSKRGLLKTFRTSSTAGYALTENKKTLKKLQGIVRRHLS